MADYPPFMNAYGLLVKILDKIREAKTPERFTQDFLKTKLGFDSGSAMAFIPFAKRLNLLAGDGTPTSLYASFRNANQSKWAISQAMRKGYADLFERNEYVYDLDQQKLEGLIVEMTGLEKNNTTVNAICRSFLALRQLADFETQQAPKQRPDEQKPVEKAIVEKTEELGLNLSYTINLVLPRTDDIAIFNAIFTSLRENLLRK